MRFVKSEEMLQILGISRPTLTAWVKAGYIPAHRIGTKSHGILYFDVDEVKQAILEKSA